MTKDSASGTKAPTPYERFVAATKAIVSVPKKEVEKAMKDLRRKRRRRSS